jgi:hypothetical protein
MKTVVYNPSPIEVKVCEALYQISAQLEQALGDLKIESLVPNVKKDNPDVVITLVDSDGDKHQVVITVIQRPD